MSRVLTSNQKAFLTHLFGEAYGDARVAKRLAGYSDETNVGDVLASLKDEIIDKTKLFLAENAPKAAFAFISAMEDPTQLGLRDKLGAAKEILDRIGLVKTERVSVETTSGVMLLPPKRRNDEENDDDYENEEGRPNS